MPNLSTETLVEPSPTPAPVSAEAKPLLPAALKKRLYGSIHLATWAVPLVYLVLFVLSYFNFQSPVSLGMKLGPLAAACFFAWRLKKAAGQTEFGARLRGTALDQFLLVIGLEALTFLLVVNMGMVMASFAVVYLLGAAFILHCVVAFRGQRALKRLYRDLP
jgi:hypothetical protein